MKKRFLLCALFILAVSPANGNGGKHGFNTYSVEKGLINNNVGALLQDRAGFIWMGTRGGLCRFDGTRFFSVEMPAVNALSEMDGGNLLIGTVEGLFRWDKSTGESAPVLCEDGQNYGTVTRIRTDKDGSIWILSEERGLFRLDREGRCSSLLPAGKKGDGDPSEFSDILPDREGVVWIACRNGTLLRFDARRNLCSPFVSFGEDCSVLCLADEDEDNLLAGLSEGGVRRVDKRGGKTSTVISGSECPAPVHSLLISSQDELWTGTESGLLIMDIQTRSIARFTSDLDNTSALPDNTVQTLCEDKEGGIWLGTTRGGAAYTSTEQNFVTLYIPSGGPRAFHGKTVRDFVEDAAGNLWIGTEDSGIYAFDPSDGSFTDLAAAGGPLPFLHISSLYLDGDTLLAGLSQQGFCSYNTVNGHLRMWPGGQDGPGTVLSIFKDSGGTCWLGTQNGVVQFDPSRSHPFDRTFEDTVGVPVDDICEDRSHFLWFACYGEGLRSLAPDRKTWALYGMDGDNMDSRCNRVLSITMDNHDYLWVGTEGGGACRFDPVSGSIRHLGTEDGLPSNTVYKVIEDKLGILWFSTSKGLSRLSPETGNFITYTYNYGAPSSQFNYKSGIKTSDGKLYFGTVRGFVQVTPEDIRTNYEPPRVVFTGYTNSGKDHFLDSCPDSALEVKLRYDHTNVSFRFASLSYTAPQNIRYAYRLRGLDKELNQTQKTEISYSRIPAGNYVLEVSAANGDGPWTDTPARLRIKVTPHFLISPDGISLETTLLILIL
ncbi:MAG: hypothetical protein IJ799_06975, partial [Bacteroidales bacterium]|nr:hypothetical protein [Bacteroidales bacterium]